jgi:hypothetical protein
MKNRLLTHAVITRHHSDVGTLLAGAYVTRQHKCTILAGDIRHPHKCFHLCWQVPYVAHKHCAFAKSTIPF